MLRSVDLMLQDWESDCRRRGVVVGDYLIEASTDNGKSLAESWPKVGQRREKKLSFLDRNL